MGTAGEGRIASASKWRAVAHEARATLAAVKDAPAPPAAAAPRRRALHKLDAAARGGSAGAVHAALTSALVHLLRLDRALASGIAVHDDLRAGAARALELLKGLPVSAPATDVGHRAGPRRAATPATVDGRRARDARTTAPDLPPTKPLPTAELAALRRGPARKPATTQIDLIAEARARASVLAPDGARARRPSRG